MSPVYAHSFFFTFMGQIHRVNFKLIGESILPLLNGNQIPDGPNPPCEFQSGRSGQAFSGYGKQIQDGCHGGNILKDAAPIFYRVRLLLGDVPCEFQSDWCKHSRVMERKTVLDDTDDAGKSDPYVSSLLCRRHKKRHPTHKK